jgi:hypothetical protein
VISLRVLSGTSTCLACPRPENPKIEIENKLSMLGIPIIPAWGRLRQEDQEFKVSLGNIVRPCVEREGDRENNRNTKK